MLPDKEISRLAQERFAAWESGDLDRVMAVYSDDVAYWDTKTQRRIGGRRELRAHLGAFLQRFAVRYAVLEEHRLDLQDAAIVLWECAVRRTRPGGAPGHELLLQRGMNLLQMRDGLVAREESYMDLAALDRLPEPAAA